MPYLDDVTKHLTELLTALPVPERESEMEECEAASKWHRNLTPEHLNPATFSRTLFSDPGMIVLVEQDERNRLAMSAETPSELVTNLIPSDGHLE